MREDKDEPISVVAHYSVKNKRFKPLLLKWAGTSYRMGKIDFYHKTKRGTTVLHHYSLADQDERIYVKITFDSVNLHWTLNECQYAGSSDLSHA